MLERVKYFLQFILKKVKKSLTTHPNYETIHLNQKQHLAKR